MELGDHMGFLSDGFKGTRYCLNVELRDGRISLCAVLCCAELSADAAIEERRPGEGRTDIWRKTCVRFLFAVRSCNTVTSGGQTDAEVREFIHFPHYRSRCNFICAMRDPFTGDQRQIEQLFHVEALH